MGTIMRELQQTLQLRLHHLLLHHIPPVTYHPRRLVHRGHQCPHHIFIMAEEDGCLSMSWTKIISPFLDYRQLLDGELEDSLNHQTYHHVSGWAPAFLYRLPIMEVLDICHPRLVLLGQIGCAEV